MQTPGVLDFRLRLIPMGGIALSRYTALGQCALREVWSAGRQPTLLPASPYNRRPALPLLKVDDRVALYNLKPRRSGWALTESELTVVYQTRNGGGRT